VSRPETSKPLPRSVKNHGDGGAGSAREHGRVGVAPTDVQVPVDGDDNVQPQTQTTFVGLRRYFIIYTKQFWSRDVLRALRGAEEGGVGVIVMLAGATAGLRGYVEVAADGDEGDGVERRDAADDAETGRRRTQPRTSADQSLLS